MKYWIKNSDESGARMFISTARASGEPTGYLMYGYDPKDNEYLRKKRGGLWSIGILKELRGQGIAKALMIAGMEHLRREGMEEAELAVDETNVTGAMRLYEHLGFAVTRRHLVWNKDLTAPAG
jgi:ribosomal protein S18 acetylase RimI-like enzyme